MTSVTPEKPYRTKHPLTDNSNKTTLLSLVCFLILGSYSLIVADRITQPASTDFYKFYKSARFFLDGKSIYSSVQYSSSVSAQGDFYRQNGRSLITLHPNLNSPLHTLTVLPFAVMPFGFAFWTWLLFSLGAGALAVFLIVKYFIHPDSQLTAFLRISLVLMLCFPTLVNIILGQYGFIVLLCAVVLWFHTRDGKSLYGGLVLGFAISIKVFFGFFLIFFAARREWRLILITLLTFMVANAIGLFVLGFNNYYQYVVQHSAVPLYITASWNASIAAFFTRIFGGSPNIPMVFAPKLGYTVTCALCLLLTVIVIWSSAARKDDPSPKLRFDLAFCLSLVAMLLISPYSWIYYFPCLILPLVIYWHATARLKGKVVSRTILCLSWMLCSWPTPLIPSESSKLNQPILWFTSAAYYHYALLSFFLLFIILIVQANKQLRQ